MASYIKNSLPLPKHTTVQYFKISSEIITEFTDPLLVFSGNESHMLACIA